jgi:hypothetical protein
MGTISLIVPETQAAIELGYSQKQAASIISFGIIFGAGLLWLI